MARSLEEQADSLAKYLPVGRAWSAKSIAGTVTRAILEGFAGELVRSAALVDEFRQEIVPDETTEFVGEWERAVGIPDGCFDGQGSVDDRRSDVLAKLASLGVQTAEDMRLLALRIYGLAVTVTTPDVDPSATFPYTFYPTGMADPGGDLGRFTFGISERDSKFELIVSFDDLPSTARFTYTFPIPFGTREVAVLECLFGKLKPANVKVTPASLEYAPGNTVSEFSLSFSGDDILLRSGTVGSEEDFDLPGSGGAFSMAAWARPMSAGDNGLLLGFWSNATAANRMEMLHNPTSGDMTAIIVDDSTGNFKLYTSPAGDYVASGWTLLVMTFDGGNSADSLKLYVNGVYDSSPTKVFDQDVSALAEQDCVASVGDGEGFGGGQGCEHRVFMAAAWDVELTADEVTAIYNGGDGQFDLRENVQGYLSAANLKLYVLPGRVPSPNLGADLGTLGIPLDEEVGVFDSDRITDVPT